MHSLFTHARADFVWDERMPEAINPVSFADEGERMDVGPLGGGVSGWLRDRDKGRRIVSYLKEHDVRAVVVNGYGNAAMQAVLADCRRRGVPAFLRGDSNIKGDRPRNPLIAAAKRAAVGWAIRQAHASGGGVMPMGEFGQQYFDKYGADRERCFWVPYEPDYAFFSSIDTAALDAFRQEHGLEASRRRLLYSGRLVGVKRVDLLIDAFAAIADERPEWDLAIAGDGVLRGELEARVPEGLRDRVRWLGFCQMDAMRLVYHASDVLVLPSDFDPWGVVVNEAMAAGLPVVASDVVGAAHELVHEGESGRLFPPGDAAALAAALREVTREGQMAHLRAGAGAALRRWRERADPVAGIRRALAFAGVLPTQRDAVPRVCCDHGAGGVWCGVWDLVFAACWPSGEDVGWRGFLCRVMESMSHPSPPKLPDFLIIGAMKAGTTTLFMDLAQHPGVYLPPSKEPQCLDHDRVLTAEGLVAYAAYYAGARPGQLLGDASTGYTKLPTLPGVPRRAMEVLGQGVKLIYIVREPIDRIISQHYHEFTAWQVGPDIDEAVRRDSRFVDYSRYAYQLEPWLEVFGREAVEVVRFEDYMADRRGGVAEVMRFLGLEPRVEGLDEDTVYNRSEGKPAPSRFWGGVQMNPLYRSGLKRWIPPKVKARVIRWLLPTAPPRPNPPSPETVEYLLDRLREDLYALPRLLGRDEPLWDEAAMRAKHGSADDSAADGRR